MCTYIKTEYMYISKFYESQYTLLPKILTRIIKSRQIYQNFKLALIDWY